MSVACAAPGVTLALLGRDKRRLSVVSAECEAKGASVLTGIADVTDASAMKKLVEEADGASPIDLAFANAGISSGTFGGGESEEQAREIFSVNLGGVLNTVLPLANLMKKRGRGQIAIMSSLAAMRGLPSAPAYSASKAAVKAWGQGLRGDLAPHGVEVSVICPGYIKTPMTDKNRFPMPLIMEPEKAAEIIMRRLKSNPAIIAFPLPIYLFLLILGLLPSFVTDPVFERLPKK